MTVAGGIAAWHALQAKLRPFVRQRVRSSADADDIVQEVLLHMQRGLPGLHDAERIGPWMYRIARNVIADHHREAARKERAVSEPSEDVPPCDTRDPNAAERELADYVGVFVAMLPSPYREALTLTELEGLTQRGAAEMLGVSLSGMKSRVQRGRALLRDVLDSCCVIAVDARGHVIDCEPRPGGQLPSYLSTS